MRILLVGIGGYGGLIAQAVLDNREKYGYSIAGVVEPYIENSPVRDQLENIPVYNSMQDFYKENKAELAIINTPIHLHKEQCILAMEMGSDVLCEKPVASTLQDALQMEEAAKATGRSINIGFQLSYTPAVQNIKRDILDGRYGKIKSMYATVSWPRNSAYFARPWAAKATVDGKWVLDSIVMNACAHYLHNMLFLAGDTVSSAAEPLTLGASVYRANDIETYDTACIEVTVRDNVTLRFTASHATETNMNPVTVIELERAKIYVTEDGGNEGAYALLDDGTRKAYGATYDDRFEKIWYAIEVARGNKKPVCTVKTALPHLKCVNAISQFCTVKPLENVTVINDVKCVVGLDKMMLDAFEKGVMPELYKPEAIISLAEYNSFEGLK